MGDEEMKILDKTLYRGICIVILGVDGIGKSAYTMRFIDDPAAKSFSKEVSIGKGKFLVDICLANGGQCEFPDSHNDRLTHEGDIMIALFQLDYDPRYGNREADVNNTLLECLANIEKVQRIKGETFNNLVMIGTKCDLVDYGKREPEGYSPKSEEEMIDAIDPFFEDEQIARIIVTFIDFNP